MACTQCHIAKVKCDKVFPCSRCVRLKRECVLHQSKQGRGSKRRRGTRGKKGSLGAEDAIVKSDTVVSLRADHYGLQYLVRSWVSFSLRRRSFSLLARAGSLATKCGISMDQILCGEESKGATGDGDGGWGANRMEFLVPLLLTPARYQQVGADRLRWSELPQSLLNATGWCGIALGCKPGPPVMSLVSVVDEDLSHLGSRWIIVRQMIRGMSRYFVSPAFERDVAPWQVIQDTWQANEKEVFSLFLPVSEKPNYVRSLTHQLSLHAIQGTPPRSSFSRTKIKLASSAIVDVNLVSCITILDLDHAFWYNEFIRRESDPALIMSSSNCVETPPEVQPVMGNDVPASWVDLDELAPGELDDLLSLLVDG